MNCNQVAIAAQRRKVAGLAQQAGTAVLLGSDKKQKQKTAMTYNDVTTGAKPPGSPAKVRLHFC